MPTEMARFGLTQSLVTNRRLSVAVISDTFERNVCQPTPRLPGDIDQPSPILVIVEIRLAIGLDEAGRGDKEIM